MWILGLSAFDPLRTLRVQIQFELARSRDLRSVCMKSAYEKGGPVARAAFPMSSNGALALLLQLLLDGRVDGVRPGRRFAGSVALGLVLSKDVHRNVANRCCD